MRLQVPSYRWRLAHLAALWGYGVSQPTFSLLKGNPEFLVVRGSTRWDVVVFAMLVAFGIPLVILAAEMLVGLVSRTTGNALHVVAIVGFGFIAALQLSRLFDPVSEAALLLPFAVGLGVGVLYVRTRAFRTLLSLSVALPVLASVLFVLTIPLATDDRKAADIDVARPTPVVLIVLDELPLSSLLTPDGSIDTIRYPNFGRLARESTWYRNATTVDDYTIQAVPAILTGDLPHDGDLPTLADHPENLFTLLGERYTLRAQEQVTVLCPSRYCPLSRRQVPVVDRQRGLLYDVSVAFLHGVLPRSMRGGLPAIGQRWNGFHEAASMPVRQRILGARDFQGWLQLGKGTGGENERALARFMRTVGRPAGRPTLDFVHLLLPHEPWTRLPSGHSYRGVVTPAGMDDEWKRWRPRASLVDEALQEHLLQLGYTDRLLGLVLDRLDETHLAERALVVVVADHGMSFRPGLPPRKVSSGTLADIAAVPLFVRYPGQTRARRDIGRARTIDVFPTIADVIGADLPWQVDGRSLRTARGSDGSVSVSTMDEAPVTGTVRQVERGVLRTARRNAALFGRGRDSLYRIGPDAELLGELAAPLSCGAVAARASLDHEEDFLDVRPSTGFVPVRLSGGVDGLSNFDRAKLALAVNGRVAATTWAYERGGRGRFVAVVPEHAFRVGENSVAVYAIDTSRDRPTLILLGGTAKTRVAPCGRTASRAAASARSSRLGGPAYRPSPRRTTAISSSR